MGSSGAEFAYGMGCRTAYSGCLGGHSHLMVHYAEHRCLKYLSLDERGLYSDDRLIRESEFTFFHRIDVSGELHSGQISAEISIFLSRKELLEKLLRH